MPEDVKASDYQDQLSPTARSILAEANMNPGASPNKGTMEETPWEGRYPNLYGVVGAAKEVGKSLLPYVKYIDPAEREKFMQMSEQQQVRDLLLEDLNMVTLGRWKPISKFAQEVTGAAMETFLPKTYEVLKKSRQLPSTSMKSLENVLAPTDTQIIKPVKPNQTVGDLDESFKKVKELQENWGNIVDKQKRGTRPHELAQEEAKNIGYTYDYIKNLSPGTTLNDSQIVALTNVVKSVADDAYKAAQIGDVKQFLNKFIALGEVDPARLGVKAESGRSLSIMNEPISGTNQYLDQFTNLLQQGNITPDRLMSMASKLKTPAQLAELAKAAQRPGFTDAVMEVWINGLLSSPVSHVANIIGNAGMLAAQVPERGIAAGIGRVFPGETEVKFGEVPQMIYGLFEGMKDGFRLATKALLEGKPQTGAEKIEWKKAFTAETFGIKDDTGLANAINLIGELVRSPGRALLGADEFFKGVAGRMELRANAYRQGVENGFEKEDLAKFIADELNKPGQQTKDAVGQFKKYVTFQNELGKSGQAFQDFVKSHPAMKLIFPFVKTPANIFKAFGERTPLGLFSKNIRADIAAGGAQRDLALARMSLGTTISGITSMYVADGTITGSGPADKNLRAAMMREGWQPYSVRIGKEYYSYARLEPFSTLIGATASAVELMGQTESGDIEADEIPAAVISAISRNILDKTFMQGFSNLILAAEEPKQFGKQYIYQLTGSVVPGFSAQLSRSIEGDVKQINSIMDSVKSRVPGFSSDVPSKVNLWGEKIEIDTFGPMMISPIRKSIGEGAEIDREIVRNKISIAPTDKQIFGVELTPKEYNRYAILAGNEAKGTNGLGLKESLTKLINTPDYIRQSDGPEGGKSLMIKAQVTYYRELAALKMLKEYPDLEAAVKLKQLEKQQNLRPKY